MSNSTITAKVLLITNRYDDSEGETYSFKAYEFANGAILIPGESTNDWFFDSRDEYEPNGTDVNESIEETGETTTFFTDKLAHSIEGSESEFGYEVGAKVRELVGV